MTVAGVHGVLPSVRDVVEDVPRDVDARVRVTNPNRARLRDRGQGPSRFQLRSRHAGRYLMCYNHRARASRHSASESRRLRDRARLERSGNRRVGAVTRFKELRRIESAIDRGDSQELQWAAEYCRWRIGLILTKAGASKSKQAGASGWRKIEKRVHAAQRKVESR